MARLTDTVTLPSSQQRVGIRSLGWEQIRASRRASVQDSARNLVAMGGSAFMSAWKEMRGARQQDASDTSGAGEQPEPQPRDTETTDAGPDLLAGHDLRTVLASGVTTPAGPEFIADLDEPDAEFLGRAILALTFPVRTEEQEKNDGLPFIAV